MGKSKRVREKAMSKHLIERFKKGEIAINLETQNEWNEFMQWLEENTDLRWKSGHKPTGKDYWNTDKEWTCVDSDMARGTYNSYNGSGYEIIKYKDLKERKGMKTSELLKYLEENEIIYKETSRNIQIINNIGLQLIRVHKKENEIIFDEETFFNNSNNSALSIEDLTKILQYVDTPIEEREEEKKYYWKLKGGGKLDNDMSHFNYQKSANEWFLSTKSHQLDIATQFTEKEFAELKSKLGIKLEFEKEGE